jgi:ankyrin repeat protein
MKKNIIIVIAIFSFFVLLGGFLYYLIMFMLPQKILQSVARSNIEWKVRDYFPDKKVCELCEAIKRKNTDKIDELLKQVDVNTVGNGNMTLLMWSLTYDDFATFCKIIELGADPNIQLKRRLRYPFSNAIDQRHSPDFYQGDSVTSRVIRIYSSQWLIPVLKHQGDPNLVNPFSNATPVYDLLRQVDFEESNDWVAKLELLINHGLDVNFRIPNESSLLEIAVRKKMPKTILTLLNANAYPLYIDYTGSDILLSLKGVINKPEFNDLKQWFIEHDFNIEEIRDVEKSLSVKSLPIESRSWLPKTTFGTYPIPDSHSLESKLDEQYANDPFFIKQPEPPHNLYAKPLNATSVKLTWNRARGANAYHIYQMQTAGTANFWVKLGSVEITPREFDVTGLSPNTTYYFQVESVNSKTGAVSKKKASTVCELEQTIETTASQ